MDPLKQHRTRIFVLSSAALILFLLTILLLYNFSVTSSSATKIWALVTLILGIFSFAFGLLLFIKAFGPTAMHSLIDEKVQEARIKTLAEFETKEEEVINTQEDIDEVVKRCLPKGSFKTPASYSEKLLKMLSDELQVSVGIIYLAKGKKYEFTAGFALPGEPPAEFVEGESLNGQVAKNQEIMVVNELPEDYFEIESGLGKSKPKTLIIVPLLQKNKTIAILEIATFIEGDDRTVSILKKISDKAAEKLIQSDKA